MQTFSVFITVTALIIWVPPTTVLFAQQTAPYIENAKKEGEVIWYGTLTGGSIVGRIIGTFERQISFHQGQVSSPWRGRVDRKNQKRSPKWKVPMGRCDRGIHPVLRAA